ncbi:MAG TPA: hypothetical protein VGE01_13055 [Fimbriimonas sp.]
MNRSRLAASLAFVLLVFSGALAQDPKFIKIHDGAHWTWFAREDQFREHRADIEAMYSYADKAFEALVDAWGLKPPLSRYTLLVMDKPGGGFAAGDVGEAHAITGEASPGIGCSYDAFFGEAYGIKAFWAHVLITHEMVNLFTGQAVSGGWPVDWWANHRSPFPLMTAVQIEYQLVPEIGVHHLRQSEKDPLVRMFMSLKNQYGWAMFRKAFRMAVQDGVQWDRFGGNPSSLRTNYVAAYLQMGAPEDISPILTGLVPGFDARVVADIVRAHQRWQNAKAGSKAYEQNRTRFLSGSYAAVK